MERSPDSALSRILIICQDFPPIGGGASNFLYNLLNNIEIINNKVGVDVICLGNKKFEAQATLNLIENITIHKIGRWIPRNNLNSTPIYLLLIFPLITILKGLSLAKKHKYNLLYSIFVIPSGIAGLVLAKLLALPHYLTIIGGDIYKPTKFYSAHKNFILKRLVRFLINHSYKINSISNDVKNKTLQFFKPNKAIEVTNIGSDLQKILKYKTSTKVIPEVEHCKDKFKFITVNRLDSRKGYPVLIEAFNKLNLDNAILWIVGDGPERENIRRKIEELKLQNKVKLLGFLSDEDKFIHLNNADAFVVASHHEGFGIVVLEAMAYGLPVVTTKSGGVEDLIKEGENGYLTGIGDVEELKEAMLKVYNDRTKSQELGKANAKRALEFDIKQVTQNYLKFLDL